MSEASGNEERQRLAALYAAMADGELEALAAEQDELTDAGRVAFAAEWERRQAAGLKPAPMPKAVSHEVVEERPLVMVARFRDLPAALLAKGSLESAGIECFASNENMVRLDWFWSNLIGGVVLQVDEADAAAAREILAAPPVDFQPDVNGEFKQPTCPKCGSLDVIFEELNRPATFALAGFVGLPIPIHRERWKCDACGASWKEEPPAGERE
jgi:ribosomal protein S27AE